MGNGFVLKFSRGYSFSTRPIPIWFKWNSPLFVFTFLKNSEVFRNSLIYREAGCSNKIISNVYHNYYQTRFKIKLFVG